MKAEKFANLVNKAKNNSEAVMEILKIMKHQKRKNKF